MKKYEILTWLGAGVELVSSIIFADDEQDAIEKLCANRHGNRVFDTLADLDDDDIKDREDDERWLYVDSTTYDGECGFLLAENMVIREVPVKFFKTIPVQVYPNPLGDCTNDGISSYYVTLYLIADEGYNELPETDTRLVVLKSENTYGDHIHKWLEPYLSPDINKAGWMNGGNIGWSSDSRFPFEYPLSIHDRQEVVR